MPKLKTPNELVQQYDAQKIAAKGNIERLNAVTASLGQCHSCVGAKSKDIYIISEVNNVKCPVHGL